MKVEKIDPNARVDTLTGSIEGIAIKQKDGHGRIDSLNGLRAYFKGRFEKFKT